MLMFKSQYLFSLFLGGQKNTKASGYLRLTSKIMLDALASLMKDSSSETRAKAFSLKVAFEKPGAT